MLYVNREHYTGAVNLQAGSVNPTFWNCNRISRHQDFCCCYGIILILMAILILNIERFRMRKGT